VTNLTISLQNSPGGAPICSQVDSYLPYSYTTPSFPPSGQVAQLVERGPEKAGVGGSIPSLATILINDLQIAKFRDELKQAALFALVNPHIWINDWVVHSEAVGSGEQAFKYLAPYIFRVAISKLKTADVKTTEPLAVLSCPHCGGPLTLARATRSRGRAP
jgi:hypothetical protein